MFVLLTLLLLVFFTACDEGHMQPYLFLNPEISVYERQEGTDVLVLAVTVDANPFSGFGEKTGYKPFYFYGFFVEVYNQDENNAYVPNSGDTNMYEVSLENQIEASHSDEVEFSYEAGTLASGNTLTVVVSGSVSYGFEADSIDYEYNFDEFFTITAP